MGNGNERSLRIRMTNELFDGLTELVLAMTSENPFNERVTKTSVVRSLIRDAIIAHREGAT